MIYMIRAYGQEFTAPSKDEVWDLVEAYEEEHNVYDMEAHVLCLD